MFYPLTHILVISYTSCACTGLYVYVFCVPKVTVALCLLLGWTLYRKKLKYEEQKLRKSVMLVCIERTILCEPLPLTFHHAGISHPMCLSL